MSSLLEAFQALSRRGIIALCDECYHRDSVRDVLFAEAERWSRNNRKVRGFAYLHERDLSLPEREFCLAILFGFFGADRLFYHDPDSVRLGKWITRCLERQLIPYEWNGQPTGCIVIPGDGSIAGVPSNFQKSTGPFLSSNRTLLDSIFDEQQIDDEVSTLRCTGFPDLSECVFDSFAGNPVRLLNVARVRRIGVGRWKWRRPTQTPRVDDLVKLSFLVSDAPAPEVLVAIANATAAVKMPTTEGMWVKVRSVQPSDMQPIYRGELRHEPMFIDSSKLRIDSTVYFTAEHVLQSM